MVTIHSFLKTSSLIFACGLLLPALASAAQTAPAVSPPPTCFIDAQPRSFAEGQPMQLTWRTQNATDVSISNIGPVDLTGSSVRYPSYGRAEYVLTAIGAGGTATCSVIVSVSYALTETTAVQGWFWWLFAPVTNVVWYAVHPAEWFEDTYIEYGPVGRASSGSYTEETTDITDSTPWWTRVGERILPGYFEEVTDCPSGDPHCDRSSDVDGIDAKMSADGIDEEITDCPPDDVYCESLDKDGDADMTDTKMPGEKYYEETIDCPPGDTYCKNLGSKDDVEDNSSEKEAPTYVDVEEE